MRIIIAILVFSLLVIFHEFGHFIFAKKNGIGVTEFALGFGPILLKKQWGETVYALKLIPFGGSCAMIGEDTPEEEAPNAFNSKSVWARIQVVAAGPVFNFILAYVCAVFVVGFAGYAKPTLYSVDAGKPAYEAGLMAGDSITKVDGRSIHMFKEFQLYLTTHQKPEYTISYERDGQRYETVVKAQRDEDTGKYRTFVTGGMDWERPTGLSVFKYGFYEVRYCVDAVIGSLKMMVQGQVSRQEVSGPVGIVKVIGNAYEESKQYGILTILLNLANLTALLSANLGVMNLLPLPALDGGRLVFLIIEGLRGKPVSREKEGYVHMAGLALLMVLMVLIMINDISNLFIQ